MMNLIATILLLIGLAGAIKADYGSKVAFKRQCLRELEGALDHLVITDKIRAMLDVMSRHHPNKPFVEIIVPIEASEDSLVALGYPEDCDTYLRSFTIRKDKARCMDDIEFDDSLRRLIGQNKRIDEVLGASSVCLLAADLKDL